MVDSNGEKFPSKYLENYTQYVYNVCMGVYEMKKRINISLDEEIAEQIKILAKDSHRNVSQWVTDSVYDAMKKSGAKGTKKNGQNSDNK